MRKKQDFSAETSLLPRLWIPYLFFPICSAVTVSPQPKMEALFKVLVSKH